MASNSPSPHRLGDNKFRGVPYWSQTGRRLLKQLSQYEPQDRVSHSMGTGHVPWMILRHGWKRGLDFCLSAMSARSDSRIFLASAVPSIFAATMAELENGLL